MAAPGPDGTGLNRSFAVVEHPSLVVSKIGDDSYRLQLGTCAIQSSQFRRDQHAVDFGPLDCTLQLGPRGAVALSSVMGTASFTETQADITFHGTGPRNPDGMSPALGASFSGQRGR